MSGTDNRDSLNRRKNAAAAAAPESVPDQQEGAYFGESGDVFEHGGNETLKLAIVGLVIVGAIAITLALIFRSVDKSHNANPAAAPSALAEHNQLMREAMQMAREAQELNRQRMAEMREAMYEAEGYAEYGEYPGAEGYVSDP